MVTKMFEIYDYKKENKTEQYKNAAEEALNKYSSTKKYKYSLTKEYFKPSSVLKIVLI